MKTEIRVLGGGIVPFGASSKADKMSDARASELVFHPLHFSFHKD